MKNKKNSAVIQKMIRDFEKYFKKKYGSLDAWLPSAYPHELSKPPTLHEMLRFKEFREAVNKELEQQGKVKFV